MHHKTAILHNTKDDTYHPIAFIHSPSNINPARHKSIGHHTEGFSSLENAKNYIINEKSLELVELVLEWDGESVPLTILSL